MPRANRYILPGYVYHLTDRCHDRAFSFRFTLDRTEYCRRMRANLKEFKVSLLNYTVTSNHIHLLATCQEIGVISEFMKKLGGEFASYYNRRKDRSGAFWGDRYHSTMIESGNHLWNCMKYIDLNMVRAGVVRHPKEWPWCGYHELVGRRQRYRMLDLDRLMELLGMTDLGAFARIYEEAITQAIAERWLRREAEWTESIAVGSESFVKAIAARTKRRPRLTTEMAEAGRWFVRETEKVYGPEVQNQRTRSEPKIRLNDLSLNREKWGGISF